MKTTGFILLLIWLLPLRGQPQVPDLPGNTTKGRSPDFRKNHLLESFIFRYNYCIRPSGSPNSTEQCLPTLIHQSIKDHSPETYQAFVSDLEEQKLDPIRDLSLFQAHFITTWQYFDSTANCTLILKKIISPKGSHYWGLRDVTGLPGPEKEAIGKIPPKDHDLDFLTLRHFLRKGKGLATKVGLSPSQIRIVRFLHLVNKAQIIYRGYEKLFFTARISPRWQIQLDSFTSVENRGWLISGLNKVKGGSL